MSETKTCSKCGEVKALDCFGKHSGRKDGIDSRCKQCNCDAAKAYRKANLEAVRAKDRIRSSALTPERRREKHQSWRDANKEHVRATGRATMNRLYQKNPEKFRNASAYYHQNNRAKCLSSMNQKRKGLVDSYVRTALRLTADLAPPELIALKREQLAIYRLAREIKQATQQKATQ